MANSTITRMGAAWAALHEGHRGNKYDGPGKSEAIAKLKKLYEREVMKLPSASVGFVCLRLPVLGESLISPVYG
jgi:hypothetical protein